MKKLIFLLLLFAAVFNQPSAAQTSKEAEVLAKVELLNSTVFGTKDRATLDGLLAAGLSYGHSGGKVEDRQEALHNATTNSNTYAGTTMKDFSVVFTGQVAIVRYLVSFDQTTGGNTVHLDLKMLQVWVKEKKQWKLTARQAVKVAL